MNLLFLLSSLSCQPDPVAVAPSTDTENTTDTGGHIGQAAPFWGEPLDDAALLRRLSLDTRGVTPSIDELDQVAADPAALDTLLDQFLSDPAFEEHLIDLLAERWLTRVDEFNVEYNEFGLDDADEFTFQRSIGEEPLRLMAHVATSDLPWSEVVTAEYTIANDLLAEIWPLELSETTNDSTDWVKATYTDDRPAGGVVMTNGMWWRYYTTPNNHSRTRAAALSRLLLCQDYLSRPISFEAPSLLEREDANEATRTVQTCVACHSTLDPLASALFGFWWFDIYDPTEMVSYHPEREFLGEYYLDTSPGYYGVPIEGAAQLGDMLAADERLMTCAVEQFAEAFWRRETDLSDFTTLQTLREDFEFSNWRARELLRSILTSDDYRVGSLADAAPDSAEERLTTSRLMSVEQLESAVEDLTGFVWTEEAHDQLANDEIGHRVLAGGIDGINVVAPERNPMVSRALVTKRLSQAAAYTVVQHDLVDGPDTTGEPMRLFSLVTLDDRPEDDVFFTELDNLHLRIHGQAASDETIEMEEALWANVESQAGAASAWASVVSVMIRDPQFWTY